MAEEALCGILTDATQGSLPSQQSEASMRQAADEYLRYVEHDRKRAMGTVSDYRSSIEKVILPFFGETAEIVKVTPERIEALVSKRLDDGVAPRTINKQLRILTGIFKRAIKVYGLPVNPVEHVDNVPEVGTGSSTG